MKPAMRASVVALTLVATSYGVAGTPPSAAEEPSGAAARPVSTALATPREITTAETQTELPTRDPGRLLVDDTHGQVFVTIPDRGEVVVTDLEGRITRTVDGLSRPYGMTISDDASTVYVVEMASASIAQIDTRTHTVSHVRLPDYACPSTVTATGGRVWLTYRTPACSNSEDSGLGVLDPATGEITSGLAVLPRGSQLRALPDRPDRLVVFNPRGYLAVYDVSSGTPAAVAERPHGSRSYCLDAALISDGTQVVTACDSEHEAFQTADLSPARSIPFRSDVRAIAVRASGSLVATGVAASTGCDVRVTDIQDGLPGTRIAVHGFLPGFRLGIRSLAFSATGRLFALARHETANGLLYVFDRSEKCPTTVTVTAPRAVEHGDAVEATGELSYAPGVETTATLTRKDRSGSHDLGTVPVASDGTFTFSDTPDVSGPVVYGVGHPGDEHHTAAGAKTIVTVRPLPYDFNADGYAETVVGVPGEDIGSTRNAGMFHVLPGGASGATGSGSKHFHQDTPGVPGGVEAGDQLGFTNTSGDFNGDGYADVAVSANAENIGSTVDAGMVTVFYGSASGVTTENATNLYPSGAAARDLHFGHDLRAGDFDGDGRDDLAVGAPGGDAGGSVFVYPGSGTGLSRESYRSFAQGVDLVPGRSDEGDQFGFALAAGDVDGDSHDDLAVGAVYDWEDRGYSTGSVTMLYGGASGLSGSGAQRLSKDTAGVPGQPRPFDPDRDDMPDRFGHQVELADVNGDGKADLTATAPGAPVWVDGVRKRDAGTGSVLYSDGAKITGSGSKQLSQQTSGMPGTSGHEDGFGVTLDSGDSNGDGIADLAIYSPGDTYVTVVRGGSAGPDTSTAKGWTQNSSGIPGKSEPGDYWGNSLRFADIKGTGNEALIVGADGENNNKGAITVIYATGSGLTGTGATYFSQNSTGIAGAPENGDWFGCFF